MTAETNKGPSHPFYEKKREEIKAFIRAELEIPEEVPLNIVGYKLELRTIFGTPKSPGITLLASKLDFAASDQEPDKLRGYLSTVAAEHSLNLGIDGVITSGEGIDAPPDAIFYVLTQEKFRIHQEPPRRLGLQEIITSLKEEVEHLSEQMKNYPLEEPDQSGFAILLRRKERLENTIQRLQDSY